MCRAVHVPRASTDPPKGTPTPVPDSVPAPLVLATEAVSRTLFKNLRERGVRSLGTLGSRSYQTAWHPSAAEYPLDSAARGFIIGPVSGPSGTPGI